MSGNGPGESDATISHGTFSALNPTGSRRDPTASLVPSACVRA